MRSVTPNAWAGKKAYIAEGSDASAEAVTFGGGEHVQIVDAAGQADIRIRVAKGRGRYLSAAEARHLAHTGGWQGVDAPAKRGWFVRYLIAAAVFWTVSMIVAGATGALTIGQTIGSILAVPLVAPILALWMRLFRRVIFS